jgi:plastocyanin
MSRRFFPAALVPLLLLGTSATAGVVRGTLHAPPPMAAMPMSAAYPGRASSLPNPHLMIHGAVTDAVVWLEKVPASADTATTAARPRLAQKDECFVPRVLPVAVGTGVDFPNLDPIFHNVFSASPVKRFDLGKYPRGQSKRVLFDKPGLVNVYCDIHAHMEAFVLVLSTHIFTQPDAAGAFALPPVPPGSYLLHVWHPDLREFQRDVTVPPQGDVALDLSW